MSPGGLGIAFRRPAPETLGQVQVQDAGEERWAHRGPPFCISGFGFQLTLMGGLVNLVKAKNVERIEEQFFFLFVLARCACGYELIDYWTSDLIELEIPGESLRGRDVAGKPRAGNEQANSGSGAISGKFLSFALRPSASWRGVPQGLSQDFRTPRVVSEESSGPGAGRAPGEAGGRGRVYLLVGTCLP